MFDVGDEVITCLGPLRYSNGEHRHSDECFEVRVVLDKFTTGHFALTDLLGAYVSPLPEALHAAPAPLLSRKSCYYTRLVKRIRDQEIREQASAGALLDDLVKLVDLYLFVDEATARHWRFYEPATREARNSFDHAANYILEHRSDSGMGRPRYDILCDVIEILNSGPVHTVEGVGDKLVF